MTKQLTETSFLLIRWACPTYGYINNRADKLRLLIVYRLCVLASDSLMVLDNVALIAPLA